MLDDLNRQEIKDLTDKYPFLLPYGKNGVLSEDYDYTDIFPIEIPVGWDMLFLQMCEDLRTALIEDDLIDEFRFHQVKEKFGEMVCYCNINTHKIDAVLDKYCFMSKYVCSQCGKPATYKSVGWTVPFCGKCSRLLRGNYKFMPISFQDYLYCTSNRYDIDECTVKISFNEEWNRYVNSITE